MTALIWKPIPNSSGLGIAEEPVGELFRTAMRELH
jgi:hypothetical protein